MSFILKNFKGYAGIAQSNISDDNLIQSVLYPASAQTISSILGLPATEKARSQGVLQFQRGTAQGEITIIPQARFLSPSGMRYQPTAQANIVIAQDKTEQNIEVQAVATGAEFNLESGDLFTAIPALPEGSSLLNLAIAGGAFAFTLPESPSVDLAIFYCCLYFFENRSFLKDKVRPALMKNLLGILSKDRSLNIERFSPQIETEGGSE